MFDNLLKLWEEMEEKVYVEPGFRGYRFFSEYCEETIKVVNELDNLLINDGKINYTNRENLKVLGFDVFPVEKDSFGWLIGACVKKDTKCGVYFG